MIEIFVNVLICVCVGGGSLFAAVQFLSYQEKCRRQKLGILDYDESECCMIDEAGHNQWILDSSIESLVEQVEREREYREREHHKMDPCV